MNGAAGGARGLLVRELRVIAGDFALGPIDLAVPAGRVLVVVGPSGAGKSVLLDTVAGFRAPAGGGVWLGGRELTGLPPERRRIGFVVQDAALFPHLSVRANVAFSPRADPARAEALLTRFGVGHLAGRYPRSLSGGERQLVALARALAAGPDLLLLDEPLAAVDVDLAPQLRALLRSVLTDRLAVVVTHHVLDALVIADRVVVLEAGRVVEQGPTRQVLARPRSPFAARLAGLNLVPGTATATGLRTAGGVQLTGHGESVAAGRPAVAVFAPSAVAVHVDPPQGSPRNVTADRVTGVEPHGELVRVRSAGGLAADVTPAAVTELGLRPGVDAWFVVKATEVAVHPSL